MKILFWVPYPTEGPSNRFRVEQYLPYLEKKGISYTLRPFWGSQAYKILYENGYYLKKIYYFLKGSINRFKDLINLSDYDLVFIHREAYPIGGALFEKIASRRKPIVYDFDDSIFLPASSSANNIVRWLKNPRKIAQILKISTIVIAGNNYLRQYAVQYNKNVIVIPTPIDTERYFPSSNPRPNNKIIIGWIGTYSTNKYLHILKKVFLKLINKYANSIEIRLIGCRNNFLDTPGIIYHNWSLPTEIKDLQAFDIGVMPIYDDEWTRGKCAFKIIQYMAVGASVVASPVGMNKEIINDGENGFLAISEKDWFDKLCLLVDNLSLRQKFTLNGKSTIEKDYSLQVTAPKFVDVLEKAYGYARR
jgi:glycosyltransferase involved in cell wall biosynthesis